MKKILFFSIFLFTTLISIYSVYSVDIIIEYPTQTYGLTVSIVDCPSFAQPNSLQNLRVKATNSGNSTLTNVWLAWVLPSHWKVVSGLLNRTIGTMSPGTTAWNNITVNVSSMNGTFLIKALTNSSEGAGALDQKYVDVGEVAPPPSEGETIKVNMTYIMDTQIVTYVNKSIKTMIAVKNTGNVALNKVEVKVLDLPREWYFYITNYFDKILPNETKFFEITYKPMKAGNFSFRVNITSSEIYKTVNTMLMVKEQTPEIIQEIESGKTAASLEIEKAREAIEKARSVGASVENAEKYLERAMIEFQTENYFTAIEFANVAFNLADAAYKEKLAQNLDPILKGLSVILVGALVTSVVIAYELAKARKSRELVGEAAVSKEKCDECGSAMKEVYDGVFLTSYSCPKCQAMKVKEKPWQKRNEI